MENYAVILAGGKGERFWPVSRSNRPKQLLRLLSDKTMLEETIDRVKGIVDPGNILIVTSEELKGLIIKEIPDFPEENFLVEPIGRNTAPAIGLAAARIIKKSGDGIMFVLSSDHRIHPVGTFTAALESAKKLAEKEDRLVLLGIEPTRPETGYGYIEIGQSMDQIDGFNFYNVASFREKPNRLLAQEYYLDGCHLWNSGIFIWKASKIMSEMARHIPDRHEKIDLYMRALGTDKVSEVLEKVFKEIDPISIDVGILEKSHSVAVLRARFTWDDVGSYAALERILSKDSHGNVISGEDVHLFDSYEMTVVNDSDGLIVSCGVSDLVLIRMDDVVLVIHKARIDQMRDILDKVKQQPDLEEYL